MYLKDSKVAHPSLKVHLKPILENWLQVIESYSKEFPEDELYWNTERATVSTLAGVIWRMGMYAEEAYSDYKKRGKNIINGRVDLWFMTDTKTEYVVEAKQIWPKISIRAKNIDKRIKRGIKEAKTAIKKTKAGNSIEDVRYLGIVFVVPILPAYDQDDSTNTERFKGFIQKVEKADSDFYGYYLSEENKNLEEGEDLYPGVALLGKLV